MLNKHPLMKLSRDEDLFLRHWIYDEVHYQESPGQAKRLQVQHGAIPADLAVLIAAAMPDLAEQEMIGLGPPPAEPPTWPWSCEALHARLTEARASLDAEGNKSKESNGITGSQVGAQRCSL